MARLQGALEGDTPAVREGGGDFPGAGEEIVVTPLGPRMGVSLEIRGDLAALLARDGEARVRSGLVAGAGFEPATFRL